MRPIVLLIFLLIQSIQLSAQDEKYEIELTEFQSNTDYNFYFREVVDNRADTTDIGIVQIGISNKQKQAILNERLTKAVLQTLQTNIPIDSTKTELVFIVHDLNVYDKTTSIGEKRHTWVEVEVARKEPSGLISLGIFECESGGVGMAAPGSHGRRISNCLESCIESFSKTDWQYRDGYIVDLDNKYSFNFKEPPIGGAYLSFGDLAHNRPLTNFEFDMIALYDNAYPKYFIEVEDGMMRDDIRYVCYNDTIYISVGQSQTGRNIFLKSKQMGKYLYFEAKYASPEAAAAFGLIGAAASNKGRGLYFDTEVLELKELTNIEIYHLTSPGHPEIIKAYRHSKRGTDDLEEVIRSLNVKYANRKSQD